MRILRAFPALVLVCACFAAAQDEKYTGPHPPKPDIPYLMLADSLVQTEVGEASEQQKGKNEVAYVIKGAASPARTPLAEPIFLLDSEKLSPESLQLYRLEVKNGNREVVMSKKRGAKQLRLTVTRVDTRLYRIDVDEGLGLENGEYSLSPTGANTVFCFAVY